MSIPRISVDLTEDGKKMTVEWYRALSQNSSGAPGTTPGSGVTLAQFNGLQAQVVALESLLNDYEARIKALEQGYQS